jgi:hypothetical protein
MILATDCQIGITDFVFHDLPLQGGSLTARNGAQAFERGMQLACFKSAFGLSTTAVQQLGLTTRSSHTFCHSDCGELHDWLVVITD